jgi:poly(3-hydroxybutyrate) depolymerase
LLRTNLKRPSAVALLTCLFAAFAARAADAPSRLGALPIAGGKVTVSGVSAGGAMAVQFHTAHSRLVQGVAALAAPPYLCAEGDITHALGRCMKDGTAIPLDRLRDLTAPLAADGSIDPLDGMRGDRIWLYHGAADPAVSASVVDALERSYVANVRKKDLVRIERDGAGHNFPVATPGRSACATSEPPYIASCDYDAARALLTHLYGRLAANGTAPQPEELRSFDQRPYAQQSGSVALDDTGWIYVPPACAKGEGKKCRLHVVFHGCRQGASFIGDAFVRNAGYLEAARANRIVVLFPQVKPTTAPLNPLGCWDWWGYEGKDYATQSGHQIRAVRAMVADLLGETAP